MISFSFKVVVFQFLSLILYLVLPGQIFADGVQLSSTSIGTTATLTAQIPQDPCGVHKLGETKNRTVSGFKIATTPFYMSEDGIMILVNEKRADLTDAIVTNFTISGRKITDFKSNPEDYSPLNWQDFIHVRRTFTLDAPIEFTPQDSASIAISNVKIVNKGKIRLAFSLLEPTGQFCLGARTKDLTIGEAQETLSVASSITKEVEKKPSPSRIPTWSIPTLKATESAAINSVPNKFVEKDLSPLEKIMKWLLRLIRI